MDWYEEVGAHSSSSVTRRQLLQLGLGTALATGALAAWRVPMAMAAGARGGHATVLNYAFPEVLDPHLAGTLAANAAISPLYNQVVEFNPLKPSEVIGDLAKSWEVSEDGLTYTFHLHENVTWWDGKPLTAADVAFSIQRMIEPGKPRPRVGLLRPSTKSATVVDRYTVQIHLNYPSASFVKFLAVDYMKIVPKHIVEAGIDINRWENIVGSGPFKIAKMRRGNAITYARNPTYFKPNRPYLDGFTLIAISDAGTAAAATRAGKIHATTGFTTLAVEDLLRLEEQLHATHKLYREAMTGAAYICASVERQPWTDLRLIKALRLATDQQEIQQAIGAGQYTYGAPFPVGSWYGSSVDELLQRPGYGSPKTQDIAAAKALLKEAGYDPPAALGKRILHTGPISFFPDLAQLWAAQMRRNLGLEITIKIIDTPTAVTMLITGNYDLGLFGYAFNIDDPDDYVNAIYGPGTRNYTRWKNPQFLRLFEQQSRELDPQRRRQILRNMEELLFTVEDPYITVAWGPLFFFATNKVKTEAGSFIGARTMQTILKQEHWWLEDGK